MKIFELDIDAIRLALEAASVEEQDILPPEVPVTEHTELGGTRYEFRLELVKILN